MYIQKAKFWNWRTLSLMWKKNVWNIQYREIKKGVEKGGCDFLCVLYLGFYFTERKFLAWTGTVYK